LLTAGPYRAMFDFLEKVQPPPALLTRRSQSGTI
jgi:hypothetical protein